MTVTLYQVLINADGKYFVALMQVFSVFLEIRKIPVILKNAQINVIFKYKLWDYQLKMKMILNSDSHYVSVILEQSVYLINLKDRQSVSARRDIYRTSHMSVTLYQVLIKNDGNYFVTLMHVLSVFGKYLKFLLYWKMYRTISTLGFYRQDFLLKTADINTHRRILSMAQKDQTVFWLFQQVMNNRLDQMPNFQPAWIYSPAPAQPPTPAVSEGPAASTIEYRRTSMPRTLLRP